MRNLKLIQIFITIIFLYGTHSFAYAKTKYIFHTNDFFVSIADRNSFEKSFEVRTANEVKKNCREHIREIMCIVEPGSEEQSQPRECLRGGEAYAHFFETLYDHYPLALQKMFCSLNVIYIEKNFKGTAYAGVIKDTDGKMMGSVMGIRQSVLDKELTLQNWASWKEQLSFGGIVDSYSLSKGLPLIGTKSDSDVNDFLYFVVAHEFGHIFDFANNLNSYNDQCSDQRDNENYECEMHQDSWGAISWFTNKRPRSENEFENRNLLCFYWCDENYIAPESINKLYSDLYFTDFISIYATTQPWDDFADSLAYYMLNQNLKTRYRIDTSHGINFDIMAKLESRAWSKKFNYIKSFIESENIIYP
jgi:hypothetical protein